MLRAAPGLRRISPARSRVSTIWWTEGGVTPKCRCKAPSRCCWRARRSHTRRLCQPDRPNFARPGAAQYRKATCHQSNRRYGKPCTPRSRREQPGARAALNAGNEPALLATLHFPHYRLARGRMRVWDQPGAYLADFLARAGADWHHSEWDFPKKHHSPFARRHATMHHSSSARACQRSRQIGFFAAATRTARVCRKVCSGLRLSRSFQRARLVLVA